MPTVKLTAALARLAPYAAMLGVDPATLHTVVQVESGNIPWVIDGYPLTRLELHHVWSRSPVAHQPLLDDFIRVDGKVHYLPRGKARTGRYKNGPWQGHRYCLRTHEVPGGYPILREATHLDGDWSWVSLHDVKWSTAQHDLQIHCMERLVSIAHMQDDHEVARKAEAAVWESASYGGLQVMGFNFRDGDHASAADMFGDYETEPGQLISFVQRVLSKPHELSALRRGNFLTFAASYNGPGQPEVYAARMTRLLRETRRELRG
jgi:hypothetical protein